MTVEEEQRVTQLVIDLAEAVKQLTFALIDFEQRLEALEFWKAGQQ